jgi:hypothetical protein
MAADRKPSSRSLVFVMIFMAIVLLLFSAAHYFVLETLTDKVDMVRQADELLPEHRALLDQFAAVSGAAGAYYIPAAGLILLVIGLLLWRTLCRPSEVPLPEARPTEVADRPAFPPTPSAVDAAAAAGREQRLFLHLLSVLQRDGRLLDFLAENLEPYEDGQIGAAVRTIHENCKRALAKYVALEAVVAQREDDAYRVTADFDSSALKLTGNVSGEPPFEGVVRHRGWRAAKLEIPTFSGGRENRVIQPAEIEIL